MTKPVTTEHCIVCGQSIPEGLEMVKGSTITTKFKKLVVAVEQLLGELEDDHGGGHHDEECPICRAIYKVEEAAGLEHDR